MPLSTSINSSVPNVEPMSCSRWQRLVGTPPISISVSLCVSLLSSSSSSSSVSVILKSWPRASAGQMAVSLTLSHHALLFLLLMSSHICPRGVWTLVYSDWKFNKAWWWCCCSVCSSVKETIIFVQEWNRSWHATMLTTWNIEQWRISKIQPRPD